MPSDRSPSSPRGRSSSSCWRPDAFAGTDRPEKGRTPGWSGPGVQENQVGCGGRIRTSDLRVMSASVPAPPVYDPRWTDYDDPANGAVENGGGSVQIEQPKPDL